MSPASHVVLHQFPSSHYNEKARWALDWKSIRHRRKNYLPGPHAGAIKKLTGQTSTPVLEIDGEITSGSAAIIDRLEERFPEAKTLYPSDPDLRAEALSIQRRFDEEVGPAARTALFSVSLNEGSWITQIFASPHPLPTRLIYRMAFPIAKRKVSAAYRTNDAAHVDSCRQVVDDALDFVAATSGDNGFLVGEQFSVADLTCASLLAVLADPPHVDMRRPRPLPSAVDQFLGQYTDHPGITWVRSTYEKRRPEPCCTTA